MSGSGLKPPPILLMSESKQAGSPLCLLLTRIHLPSPPHHFRVPRPKPPAPLIRPRRTSHMLHSARHVVRGTRLLL